MSLSVKLCVADGRFGGVKDLGVVGAVNVEDFSKAAAVKGVEVLVVCGCEWS